MLTAADEWNKRLREQMPEGFALDETHRPHITLLQQYVAEKDLDAVVAVVKSLAATANLEKMKLTAKGLYHIPGGKIGLQGITIKPSDEIPVNPEVASTVEKLPIFTVLTNYKLGEVGCWGANGAENR